MKKRLNAIISGRVQLVMFRDFVCRNARKLGLFGTVQNMKSGSVTVVAEGEERALNELLVRLYCGPILARVDGIEVRWAEPSGAYSSFTIIYDKT